MLTDFYPVKRKPDGLDLVYQQIKETLPTSRTAEWRKILILKKNQYYAINTETCSYQIYRR